MDGVLLLPVLTTLLLTLTHVAAAQAEHWTPPLRDGPVLREFRFDAHAPFARGARRGVLLAGPPGTRVGAPCSGRVTFTGRHPRLGWGLTLRCGALVATEFGLERRALRRGAGLIAGAPVGTLGSGGALYLGARRAGERWGYRDPLALLARRADGPAPLAPRPPRRSPRDARPARPRGGPQAAPPAPAVAPLLAWAGLAAAGVGAGAGITLRRRGLRSRQPEPGRRAESASRTH